MQRLTFLVNNEYTTRLFADSDYNKTTKKTLIAISLCKSAFVRNVKALPEQLQKFIGIFLEKKLTKAYASRAPFQLDLIL
jgi:hypothetical protein